MTKQTLGLLIAYLRQKNNMLQKDLADIMNVSASAVSKWEKGINYPDVECMQILASQFQLAISDFYHPEETLSRLQASDKKNKDCSEELISTISSEGERTVSRKQILFCTLLSFVVLLCVGFEIFFFLRNVNDDSSVLTEGHFNPDYTYENPNDLAFFVEVKVSETDQNWTIESYLAPAESEHKISDDSVVCRMFYYPFDKKVRIWKKSKKYTIK